MVELWLASLLWAFSFGLIKGVLTGVDPILVAFARLLVSFLLFLPFIRIGKVEGRLRRHLALCGAVQFGVMYLAYIYSFQFLKAYEVALFTIFTPLFVNLIDGWIERKFQGVYFLTAGLTVVGTGLIAQANLSSPGLLVGFGLVQISNLAFAFGQVYYRQLLKRRPELRDEHIFGVVFLGAAGSTGLAAAFFVNWSQVVIDARQFLTLIYLGAVASGLGFFVWNRGARKVNTGALAIFNDLKVPLATGVSLLFFGEQVDLTNLLLGGLIVIAALALNELWVRRKTAA